MTIPTGSGSEVIGSKLTTLVTNSYQDIIPQLNNANKLIIVLSVMIHETSGAARNFIWRVSDNDGSSNLHYIYQEGGSSSNVTSGDTFIHNDKFCIVGDKRLMMYGVAGSDFDVTATYIIQDWT